LKASAETPGASERRDAELDAETGVDAVDSVRLGRAGANFTVAGSATLENSSVWLPDLGALPPVVAGCETAFTDCEGVAATGAARETALNTGNASATTFDEAHTDRLKSNARKRDKPLRRANRS
jgi:hypothetical protein